LGINGERYFTKRQVQSMIKDSYFAVDALTQRDNVFTRMDARIKVILCITAVITVFAIPGFKFALGLFGVIMAALFFIRAPRRLIRCYRLFAIGIFPERASYVYTKYSELEAGRISGGGYTRHYNHGPGFSMCLTFVVIEYDYTSK